MSMSGMSFRKAEVPMGKSVCWSKEDEAKDPQKKVYLGDQVLGEYAGHDEGVGENESHIYRLKLEDGTIVTLWGSTLIDDRFAQGNEGQPIPIGAIVRLTNRGFKKTLKGGREYRDMLVEFAIPSPAFKAAGGDMAQVAETQGQPATSSVAPAKAVDLGY